MDRTGAGGRREDAVHRAFRILLGAAVVATFSLVTLGGVVRVTGSGLACPDWPLCQGQLIPPAEFHTFIEYAHRLAASLTTLLVVAAAGVAWWRYRHNRRLVVPLTATLGLLGLEVVLGGVTVLTELPPTIVTLHLALAEAIFALLLIALVWSWRASSDVPSPTSARQAEPGALLRGHSVYRWGVIGAMATYGVLLSGSYAVGRNAGLVCSAWPLCDGGLVPSSELEWVHMAHRALSGAVGLLVAWVALASWRHRAHAPAVAWAGVAVGAALVAQTVAGAANPWSSFATAARAAHLSLATALWGSLVILVVLARPLRTGESTEMAPADTRQSEGRLLKGIISDYVTLTKPPIILLLLITALGGMFLAAQGLPPLGLMALVLVGGSLGAGGANALNHYLDRDIDERMFRTRRRPVPGGRIEPQKVLLFGVLLNVLAFALLTLFVNLLSALLTLSATLFYVFVYTRWLKRTTPQNIVIGGAAGAVPPLVGWAAVTGGLDLPALYLFAIVFFWTPPHFWALSLLLRTDYARAGVPMLPVVRGVATTARYIMMHAVVLVTLTLLFSTVQAVGVLYLLSAIVLGALFLSFAWRLLRSGGARGARPLYLYSLAYLAGLFLVVMVDSATAL